MKACVKMFDPQPGSSINLPGRRGGVVVDANPALKFMSEIGPMLVIGVTVLGPRILVWYWEDEEETQEND